ncbi:MAG: 16S rRNA (uracil(1498)-N(3))-methyltransferase [Pirellulaceae bacterium]|nr:16S rRNA (uracil(1498)-N(3))-methyltransferase [Pirellulaceae bacterium]
MTRRYYVPELPPEGGLVSLSDTEAQHALRVMRAQANDALELFDGRGHQADATVTQVNRRECHCLAKPAEVVDREPATKLHLGIALPKPDRARELIERLTELGVQQVTPIVAQRTQRPPTDSLLKKLRRGVIESCKQCERNLLMTVSDPVQLEQFLDDNDLPAEKWIAHPTGDRLASQQDNASASVIAIVGPEGGWTEDEVSAATNADYQTIALGPRIFRIETAAAYLAARLID